MLSVDWFIEYPGEFTPEYSTEDPAYVFRRAFRVGAGLQRATLSVCGVGYGYYYINGGCAAPDLFTAPVSDYRRTLWYNVYDVTDQLHAGENLLAAIVGNGFYNESMVNAWYSEKAAWRALSKFALQLELTYADHTEVVVSDEDWLCSRDASPVRFNQLRSGERYDARLGEAWRMPGFDDSAWTRARRAASPGGVLRRCECEPIREQAVYPIREVFQNAAGNWVVDFGQNFSGYLRVRLAQEAGDVVTVRYAERLTSDGARDLKGMDAPRFYAQGEFQTDRFICSGETTQWSPRFAYHGFRFAEIEGLREKPSPETVEGVFVHQAIAARSTFDCSEETLCRLWHMARMATWSNLFYMPTDCPTREKYGWTNDAQASTEQMLQNYQIERLLEKWLQDIFDAMREDGKLPGIVPTHGWGFDWGDGPVSNGILFELPMQVYRYTDRFELLERAYPYFLRYLAFLEGQIDPADGLIGYGLPDWAGPFEKADQPTPLKCSDTLLTVKFCRMAAFTAEKLGDAQGLSRVRALEERLLAAFRRAFVAADGRCLAHAQTAVSMMIVLGVYDDLAPLRAQLRELLEEQGGHHNCGMLGMQYLYPALDKCGMQEEAYRVLTAKGFPSYTLWIEGGATALCERWNLSESENHHMYSCFTAWMNQTLVGLRLDRQVNAYKKAVIAPFFAPQLAHCSGRFDTVSGVYAIAWRRREDGTVLLTADVPAGAQATLALRGWHVQGGAPDLLSGGHYEWICEQDEQPSATA